MGGKQTRRRLHVPFYIACIFGILLTLAACAQLNSAQQRNTPLARAQDRMEWEDFSAALIENEKALSGPLPISRERALFQRGVIYAHPKNPDRDDRRAAELFQQVVDQYPGGELSSTARVLISLFNRLSSTEKESRALFEKMDQVSKSLEKQEKAAGLYRSELTTREAKIEQLNSQIKDLKSQIEDLKSQIEKIKTIDLNIEKMKQKTGVQ